jgi:molybdopterin-guanine dinucleotide biosynthesis protein A
MRRAAVLAGGQSSRMGQDKALLTLNGITLLEQAVQLLQQSGAEQVLVSGRVEHPLGVPDLLPHCGPPGALLSLLDWLEARKLLDDAPLLLIPVDMPLLVPELLQPLWQAAKPGVSCRYAGEVFPCIVPAAAGLLAHLRQLFADEVRPGGQRSMKAVFNFLDSVQLDIEPRFMHRLVNVNTPADWQALASGGAGQLENSA